MNWFDQHRRHENRAAIRVFLTWLVIVLVVVVALRGWPW